MNVSELNEGVGDVSLEAEVVGVGDVREFNKYGRVLKVANVDIKDESGTIKLTLWNDNISKVKVGDKIKIEKGYVNSFQGALQVTLGKFGTLEVIQ